MQALWMILASFLFACMGDCVTLAAASHSAVESAFCCSFLSLPLIFALLSPCLAGRKKLSRNQLLAGKMNF